MDDIKKQFNDLILELESLVPNIRKEISSLGPEFVKQLKSTHLKEQDPYNKKWAPRKDNEPHPILYKTGKLYKSYKAYPRKDGTLLTNTSYYMIYHQDGTSNMVPRKLLPGKVLPDSFILLIKKRIEKIIKEFNE
jgi:hypothetical protein